MYCFSHICRICLKSIELNLIQLNYFDLDNVQIHDKLIYCIPEIFSPFNNLPEHICDDCYEHIQHMYKFKQMCIENTITLNKYASKLSKVPELFNKNNLIIKIEKIFEQTKDILSKSSKSSSKKKHLKSRTRIVPQVENTNTSGISNNSLSSDLLSNSVLSEGIPMYSVTLNQWDLFETKYTCRCIKEFSSFTENTEHLCKNCEGELLGFRLSKIKVGVAEGRYNNRSKNNYDNEDSISNPNSNCDETLDIENVDSDKYERGFDYNDLLLCKVHVNGVKKQIKHLENNPVSEHEHEDEDEDEDEDADGDEDEVKNEYVNNKSTKKIKYNNKMRHTCIICKKSFSRRYYLNNHFLSHAGSRLHECDQCGRRYINKDDFDKHQLGHFNATKSKQELALFNLGLKRGVNSFSIDIKKPSAVSPTTIKSEVPSECESESESKFEYKSESESESEEHNQSKSSKNSDLNSSGEILACGTCDKIFTSKGKLAIHLMTHFGKKDYRCPICYKEFFRKENLDLHLQNHQQQSVNSQTLQIGNKFKCPACDKCYNHLTNVRRHMRENHNTDKFLCSICNRQFIEKRNLEQHIFDVHTQAESVRKNEQKNYSCPVCNKHFSHLSNLRMHALSHSDVADTASDMHFCNICKKHYSKNTSMSRHMLTHISGNVYSCIACTDTFDNRWVQRQHMKSVHPNFTPIFQCAVCSKTYTTKFSLQKHSRSHTK